MMKTITLENLLPNPAYLQVRDAYRREVIAHKENRRIEVGPQVTLVFEDRKTTLFQIQEILRVEGIADPEGMQAEVDIYNAILPRPGQLSATVMITFSATEEIRAERKRLVGLMEHVSLQIGGERFAATFEAGRETDERISAVQYVAFTLGEQGREALASSAEAALVIEHPGYEHRATLWPKMRASLLEDLAPSGEEG